RRKGTWKKRRERGKKRAEFVWHKVSADNVDPDFVERRQIGLENFVLREGSWKETVNETEFQLKAGSRLKVRKALWLGAGSMSLCSLTRSHCSGLGFQQQPCDALASGAVRTFSLKGVTTKLFG
ncbi:hypothetical protein A6R68_23677, partial [Neotoma lepida]